MAGSQYISVREAAQTLSITEKKVMDLLEEKKLIGYRIADQFLRLKKEEVLNLRDSGKVETETLQYPYTTAERVKDFLFFNDFYLAAGIIILTLLYVIFYVD